MAFVIAEDHARQEAVCERLSYNRDASTIRRLLTETHVAATDRRAVFVGVEAYTEAGGTILRDLFTEDRGGYFENVALLDLLVTAKLGRAADALREAEGWKWTEVHLDFPHAHGMRRTYPHQMELSVEDQAVLEATRCEVDHGWPNGIRRPVNLLTMWTRGFASLRRYPSGWKPSDRPMIRMTSHAAGLS
jgi:ParB family chromosome partitioning protein